MRPTELTPSLDVAAAADRACARIAPTWPLDRFIAVNPFWAMIDRPLPAVSAELTALSGSRLLMPRAWYRAEYESGRLRDEHLRAAIDERRSPATVGELRALLDRPEPATPRRARVMDVADARRDLTREASWRDFITNSVSQFCASYFDEGQATFGPDRSGGLYAAWRRHARDDRSPALLMSARAYGAATAGLPATAREMTDVALGALDVPPHEREAYLTGLLLDLNGWAAWCAYRRWTAQLAGATDDDIVDLLGILLAWEWLLHGLGGREVARGWDDAMGAWPGVDAVARASQVDDWLLQRAMELAWERDLCGRLPAGLGAPTPTGAAVQAVFCIDVRSEVMRRALEAQSEAVQTLGFAGFFGLPVDYQPAGAASARPQLPGLLAPRLRAFDSGADDALVARRAGRLDAAAGWDSLRRGAVSAFAFVESMGPLYAPRLLAESFGLVGPTHPNAAGLSRAERVALAPRLGGHADGRPMEADERADLAAGMLRAMSLTRGFARLVVLVGHGGEARNNPHAAGLDCGACGGQTGEVNARAAAALLNEPDVRAGLAARGIDVPPTTRFAAALHHTTTDDVTLFADGAIPASHDADVSALRGWLVAASAAARRERSPALGLDAADPALREAMRRRARDWSQVRPEWGLAGNASFIVAPRERSRHLHLGGRAFLHEYRFEQDDGFGTLKLIMTAPMVVAHWINLQYYASTVDNGRYGSGDKTLHNVVGGHLGVFEGNGGDLRIGLPLQSLRDGARWVHTPLRLSVFIEAPRAAIEGVLAGHDAVRALIDNGWVDLYQIDAGERAVHAYRGLRWSAVPGRAEG